MAFSIEGLRVTSRNHIQAGGVKAGIHILNPEVGHRLTIDIPPADQEVVTPVVERAHQLPFL
jgi:hypothetical protein